MTRVWELQAYTDGYVMLQTRLQFFDEHFIGQRMAKEWKRPRIEIDNRTRRLADFVSWDFSAPVVSERARHVLLPALGADVEMLDLIKLRKVPYFAMNVCSTVKLDEHVNLDKSDVDWNRDRIAVVRTLAFHRVPSAPIFKLREWPKAVFVTRSLVALVISAGLTGAVFADPSKNAFRSILRGDSPNDVPGALP